MAAAAQIYGSLTSVARCLPDQTHPDIAILETVGRMARATRRCARSPVLLAAAHEIAGADRETIARAVFGWVQRHVAFVRDEPAADALGFGADTELLIEPDRLLTMPRPSGDCDDFSMLAACLLELHGVPWEFVTIAGDSAQPGEFSHVYVYAVMESGRRLALDTSHGDAPGWEAQTGRRQRWDRRGLPISPEGREKPMTIPVNTGLHGLGTADDLFAAAAAAQTSASGSGFNWTALTSLINAGGKLTTDLVALTRSSGATVRGADGSIVSSAGNLAFDGAGSSMLPLLLLGGVGLLVVLLAAKR